MERLGCRPTRMLAQAFSTSDFFINDPRGISNLLGLRAFSFSLTISRRG
jgi:hypothetical protein